MIVINQVDNMELFISDIHNGRWDSVLSQVRSDNTQVDSLKLYRIGIGIFPPAPERQINCSL